MLAASGCVTSFPGPRHEELSGLTKSTYLQGHYVISVEQNRDDHSVQILLSCSTNSILTLFNIKDGGVKDGDLFLGMFVGIQTTHPTAMGEFYYNDIVPVRASTVITNSLH